MKLSKYMIEVDNSNEIISYNVIRKILGTTNHVVIKKFPIYEKAEEFMKEKNEIKRFN